MNASEFHIIAPTLPLSPGIYKYFDEKGNLLYVGKAKSIRKRVSSYFSKTFTSYKTHELVQRIHKIEFTIVDSEQDAFLLENALIKQFQPKFNINLKDDKTYPYIVIKNEPFPRIFLTRRHIHDGSEYLGPFTSVQKVRELLQFIKQNIPLRTCKLNLSEKNIKAGKFKVCLEYHLGNCKGPCESFQSMEAYDTGLSQVRSFLKGNLSPIIQQFKSEMKWHADQMQFEKAEIFRKKLEHLHQYQAKSTIVNPKYGDMDVFNISMGMEKSYINFLMIRNGSIIDTKTISVDRTDHTEKEEMLESAVLHFRERFNSTASDVVVPFHIEIPDDEINIIVPKSGDRKKLLELSEKNVNYFISEEKRVATLQLTNGQKDMNEVLQTLQEDLQLTDLPSHIECFDNSNFQGSYPVSAMVCFINGEPSKKDYRHYNVKTVKGINDFATMKEVVHRRYKRLLDEKKELPQLVIIDGGKGQLSAAMEAIQDLGLEGRMTLIGLAKNVEEVFFSGDSESLKLGYNSNSLLLLRRIRDEVHRFGITFHRQKRQQGTFKNELDAIDGIGKSTTDLLLKTFKSVKNISTASMEELEKLIGKHKAKIIFSHFQSHTDIEKN